MFKFKKKEKHSLGNFNICLNSNEKSAKHGQIAEVDSNENRSQIIDNKFGRSFKSNLNEKKILCIYLISLTISSFLNNSK